MKTVLPKKKSRGASVLFLSLVFMSLLLLVATALYKLVPAEFHSANNSLNQQKAHQVANAGVRQATAWLIERMKKFDATGQASDLPDYAVNGQLVNIDSFLAESNGAASPFQDASWTFELNITPDPTTIGVSHNFQPRVFQITSVAKKNGKAKRQVTAWIRQATFASFAYYTHEFEGQMRINGELGFAGPVHTNDYFRFNVLSGDQYDPDSGSETFFRDQVTHAGYFTEIGGDGNEWLGTKPYDENGPIDDRYSHILDGGRNALIHKPSIPLPKSADDIALVALGGNGSIPFPTDKGVYVADTSGNGYIDSGIYVKGDVQELYMGLDEAGNQMMIFEGGNELTGDTNNNSHYTTEDQEVWSDAIYGPWKSYNPPQYNYKWVCPQAEVWVPPPPPGDGGGMAEEPQGYWTCPVPKEQVPTSEKKWREVIQEPQLIEVIPAGTLVENFSQDKDQFERVVVEVENPTVFKHNNQVVNDPNTGQPIQLQAGQTLVATMQRDDEQPGNPWLVREVKVSNGTPNGTIYVDGSISGTNGGDNGLHGIVKGSPIVDPSTGQLELDAVGKVTYNSKIISTPLNREINIAGDLLQFDPDRFAVYTGKANLDNNRDTRHVRDVALDPNATGGPELSKTPDHVLGILTRDVWMRGKKVTHARNGNDQYMDIYAVILAGVEHSNGEVSGGFGTHSAQVDSSNGGGNMGNVRVVGGVIQGTTGKNYNGGNNTKHYWINTSGTKGYQVKMIYDKVATYQKLFPTYAAFEVIRYLEVTAK